MFTIGEFATLGRVSVRMLRHYDAIGLLTPGRVDPVTGYRSYHADQLRRLNRLLALKDLGFALSQVRTILDGESEPAALLAMLRMRQAELAQQLIEARARLDRVEARLRMIQKEGAMSTSNVTVSSVEPVTLAHLTGETDGSDNEQIGPVVSPLFQQVWSAVMASGTEVTGPAVAAYQREEDGRLSILVGCPVAADAQVDGLSVLTLPAIPQAACLNHVGPMATIGESYQALATWIEDNGYRTDQSAREVYLSSHPAPEDEWVTQLQMPLLRS